MLRKSRIAAVLGVIAMLASGCGNGDAPLSPPSAPALNGGGHIGGANSVDPPADPAETGPDTTSTAGASQDDTTPDGGGHIGGGN